MDESCIASGRAMTEIFQPDNALREVYPGIFVGGLSACRSGSGDHAVVHACKSPCHQNALGYHGSLPADDPHYLALVRDNELWLNLIDPPVPLFQAESFRQFLAFAAPRLDDGLTLTIHCNQGESRSASLALLLLALHAHVLSKESFAAARADYLRLDPFYRPGGGIARFLEEHWDALGCVCSRCWAGSGRP
jgi:hypothetical protein